MNAEEFKLQTFLDAVQLPEPLDLSGLGNCSYVTALHVRGLQFKPSCGHWNYDALKSQE